jgi:hypothetical protein
MPRRGQLAVAEPVTVALSRLRRSRVPPSRSPKRWNDGRAALFEVGAESAALRRKRHLTRVGGAPARDDKRESPPGGA